jgi:CBS domain-containing protein
MAKVHDILVSKGGSVATIDHGAFALDAAVLMNNRKIGAVVIMDGSRIAGIFTERDLMNRVIVAGKDPSKTRLDEVMTREVRACSPDSPLEECRAAMTHHRLRHLPVVNEEGGLIGIVSIGDIVAREIAHQEETIRFLNDYIQGPN